MCGGGGGGRTKKSLTDKSCLDVVWTGRSLSSAVTTQWVDLDESECLVLTIESMHSLCGGYRALELCESRGGRPGLPVPNKPYGLCGRKATQNCSGLL